MKEYIFPFRPPSVNTYWRRTGILWEDDSQIVKLHITKNTGTKKPDNFILRVKEGEYE